MMEEPSTGFDRSQRSTLFSQLPVWVRLSNLQNGVYFNSIPSATFRKLYFHCSLEPSQIVHTSCPELDDLSALRRKHEMRDTCVRVHAVRISGRNQPQFHGIPLRHGGGVDDYNHTMETCKADTKRTDRLLYLDNDQLSMLCYLRKRYR